MAKSTKTQITKNMQAITEGIKNLRDSINQIEKDVNNNKGVGLSFQWLYGAYGNLYESLKDYQLNVRPFDESK